MDLKELKKLAAACRSAGISFYKDSNCEFTLGAAPAPKSSSKKAKSQETPTAEVDTDGWDSLTDEEKLFYSVTELPETSTKENA